MSRYKAGIKHSEAVEGAGGWWLCEHVEYSMYWTVLIHMQFIIAQIVLPFSLAFFFPLFMFVRLSNVWFWNISAFISSPFAKMLDTGFMFLF